MLTFRDLSQPDVVLGGARIPVSQARFPFSFRMFPQNLLPDKVDQWNQQSRKDDILVQALICPEEIPKCQEAESRLQAQGVAKLIRNLPGQGEDQMIRAAASLPLK